MSIAFIGIFIALNLIAIFCIVMACRYLSDDFFVGFVTTVSITAIVGVYGVTTNNETDVSYTDAIVEQKGNTLVITDQVDTVLDNDVKYLNNPTSLKRYKTQNLFGVKSWELTIPVLTNEIDD